MRRVTKYIMCLALAGGGALPAAAAQAATGQVLSESAANAARAHLDEAEDLTASLLRWKHIVTGVADGDVNLRKAPANTSISIDGSDAQRVTDLIGALRAQMPPRASNATVIRGDLWSHVDKAQEIARELVPSNSHHAGRGVKTSAGAANLVTIDRTSLERLDVELDAIEMILPRMTSKQS